MSSLKLVPISQSKQIIAVCEMAETIWTEHYTPIIGTEQVKYMIDKFQSPLAVQAQLEAGYRYYFLSAADEYVGYAAVKAEESKMFLSKIYVDKAYRQRGYASQALRSIVEMCEQEDLPSLYLTVNKYNSISIAAYKRLGFTIVDEVVADIGNGFVMDDYIMEKSL